MNKNYILAFIVASFFVLNAQTASAKTSSVKITSPVSGVSIEVGTPQTIRWTSSDYPVKNGVDINLLRQISVNPNKFEFVKTIKKDTKNDGQEIWIPAIGDDGKNLVIQVSCSQSNVFSDGCFSGNGSDHLVIVDKVNRQSYSASAISGLNELIKKISDFLNFKN